MQMISKTFDGLGTKNILTLYEPRIDILLDGAGEIINNYESLLTINRNKSEIISINNAAGKHPVKVSDIVYQLVKKAVEVSKSNLGFDVAIGPLVQEWRIGFDDAHVPTNDRIKELVKVIDPNKIKLDDNKKTVFLETSGMKLDLGGIGKGYIADAIKEYWLQNGVQRGIINLGGNVLLVGNGPRHDDLWKVGIQSPTGYRDQSIGTVMVKPCSVVTSGIYERFLNKNGHNYHHIFDPKSGRPLETNLKSVTVFTNTSLEGEVWSSLAFFNGPEQTKKLVGNQNSIGYVFITNDNKVVISENLRSSFEIKNKDYLLV